MVLDFELHAASFMSTLSTKQKQHDNLYHFHKYNFHNSYATYKNKEQTVAV